MASKKKKKSKVKKISNEWIITNKRKSIQWVWLKFIKIFESRLHNMLKNKASKRKKKLYYDYSILIDSFGNSNVWYKKINENTFLIVSTSLSWNSWYTSDNGIMGLTPSPLLISVRVTIYTSKQYQSIYTRSRTNYSQYSKI